MAELMAALMGDTRKAEPCSFRELIQMPIGSCSTTTREENHAEAISAVYVPARLVDGIRKRPMMMTIGVSLTNVASDSIREEATGLSFASARDSMHEVRIRGVV